jgi:hypothetical protein
MRLAKSISLERTRLFTQKTFFSFLFILPVIISSAQNSPYSRYGLGDQVPNTNIYTRGMGSLSAGFRDPQVINFNNPASYSSFLVSREATSKQITSGRVVFDVGINIDNRTLRAPNNPQKFTSTNAQFSYLQVGAPLKHNWGLVFGLRQLTRVGYDILQTERLRDPITGAPIDSIGTRFQGDGGSFLPTIGTGVALGKFSAGINIGYLFGKKDIGTRRGFLNDSVLYAASVHESNYSFGGVFFNGGLQYNDTIGRKTALTIGISGNLKQNIKGRQDIRRATFVSSGAGEELEIDSVFERNDIEGEIIYPASFTYGFMINRFTTPDEDRRGWTLGVDFMQNGWDQYRFFGAKDSVANSWEVRLGGQLMPHSRAYVNGRYTQLISYRAGVFLGKDYITAGGNELPLFGASFGVGLPVWSFKDPTRYRRNQFTNLNLSFEYINRGNNNNRLKENTFRISAGFNFTDWWFSKRKYD